MHIFIKKIFSIILVLCFLINTSVSTVMAFEDNLESKKEDNNIETITENQEYENEEENEKLEQEEIIEEKEDNEDNIIQSEKENEEEISEEPVKEPVEEIEENEELEELQENNEETNELEIPKLMTKQNIMKSMVMDEIESLQVDTKIQKTTEPTVKYNTHIQNIGWQDWKTNGQMAGTSGQSLRLEALNITLENMQNINIRYQVHIQNIGWQSWKTNGATAGTSGQSLRLEALRIQLDSTDDYSIMYRVHVQNIGWQEWKTDGELAGTEGQSLRLEALEIKIVPKQRRSNLCLDNPTSGTVLYSPSTINVKGWKLANVSNTYIKAYFDGVEIDSNKISYYNRPDVTSSTLLYGTPAQNSNSGFSFDIDTSNSVVGNHRIVIDLYLNSTKLNSISSTIKIDKNIHVTYRSHVQNIGWQGYVLDGNISGTTGMALRVEAMNISLYNAPSGGKIKYRAHVQNDGWQGWKKDGQMAGTSGLGRRIEALQIALENMPEYTVEYRVHVEDIGWTGWYIDGETAGTVGQAKRIEAIQIRIVKKYKREYNGIDVSQYQGNINWQLVKASGMDFAFIRVGFRGYGQAGNFKEDNMYRANMSSAKNAGMKVGVYFVTQATTYQEAVEEANWVIERLRTYKIDYPVALDLEEPGKESPTDVGRAEHLDRATRTYLAKVFCEKIQNAGYTPMIYTNIDWAINKLYMSELSAYDTWIAHYTSASKTSYTGSYAIWQWTSKGSVNGVSGNVDMNRCYKKY